MCTVTFIPTDGKVFITHNRDEQKRRAPALPPDRYTVKGESLLFPRDGEAGGSWIALNERGGSLVLLNGANEKHIPKPPYRQSRGVSLLSIAASEDLHQAFKEEELENIEPFTLIIYDKEKLSEGCWDGTNKDILPLDPRSSYLWSSVTLYDEAIRQRRREWLHQWLAENPFPSQEDILAFHLNGGEGDLINDLRINREDKLLTLSISSLQISSVEGSITYLDLQQDKQYHQTIHFKTNPEHLRV